MDAMARSVPGRRTFDLLFHMVNNGELTVGEARAELQSNILDRASVEFLAGWILDRADQGDGWRAGDPVVRPDGKRVAYVDECVADRHLVQDGDDTWTCDPEWADHYGVSSAVR